LTGCSQDTHTWEIEEKRILKEIWGSLETEDKENFSEQVLYSTVLPETHVKRLWREKLARGIVEPAYCEKLIDQGLSKSRARKILTLFLEKWLHMFQKKIWKERCTLVAEWEKSSKINQREKRAKVKKKRRKKKKEKEILADSNKENDKFKEKEENKEWNQIKELSFKEILKWIKSGVMSEWNRN
jgi:hypothetical protein